LQEQTDWQVQQDKGVVVVEVLSNSPAANAKLQTGDVIVKIGKTQIDNTEQLQQLLQSVTPEDRLTLTVIRGNRARQIQLKVGTVQPKPFSRQS
jgi:S1-C subfamily serine protease